MPVIYKRNCDHCGKYYEKAGAKRFCSNKCVGLYNSDRKRYDNEPTKEELHNLYINKKLGTYQIATKLNIPVSCIKRRMNKYKIKLRSLSIAQLVAVEQGRLKKGKDHPQWKGGKKCRKDGYISILKPKHHRANKAGYVQEHVIVWEKFNNKKLPDGWVVHHLNGNKHDNRFSNLLGLKKEKHYSSLVIEQLQIKIIKLENRIKKYKKSYGPIGRMR